MDIYVCGRMIGVLSRHNHWWWGFGDSDDIPTTYGLPAGAMEHVRHAAATAVAEQFAGVGASCE